MMSRSLVSKLLYVFKKPLGSHGKQRPRAPNTFRTLHESGRLYSALPEHGWEVGRVAGILSTLREVIRDSHLFMAGEMGDCPEWHCRR